MKRQVWLLAVLLGFGMLTQAQINPRALGFRFGGNGNINGAEVSYQHKLSSENRLEFDLGWGGNSSWNRLFVVGIYHWNWNIDGGLNWYVGPGASLGFYSYNHDAGYLNIAVGGQIGLEYDFNKKGAPLLLSLDARPMWDFLGSNAGLGWGTALGLRYTF